MAFGLWTLSWLELAVAKRSNATNVGGCCFSQNNPNKNVFFFLKFIFAKE
jgi:hypothetical protein